MVHMQTDEFVKYGMLFTKAEFILPIALTCAKLSSTPMQKAAEAHTDSQKEFIHI